LVVVVVVKALLFFVVAPLSSDVTTTTITTTGAFLFIGRTQSSDVTTLGNYAVDQRGRTRRVWFGPY